MLNLKTKFSFYVSLTEIILMIFRRAVYIFKVLLGTGTIELLTIQKHVKTMVVKVTYQKEVYSTKIHSNPFFSDYGGKKPAIHFECIN